MDKDAIHAIEELTDSARGVVRAEEDAIPYVILPPNHSVKTIEETLPTPTRYRNKPVFVQPDSFTDYVNELKSSNTRIYVTSPIQIVAVIDHQHDNSPAWGDHRATLNLVQDPDWLLWKQKNATSMSQRDFAQFLEDNIEAIVAPSGAELIDLIRNIKASQKVEITGNVQDPDNASGSFVIETKGKGGKGDLELPSEIALALPVYFGGTKDTIKARLRFQISQPSLSLRYELIRVERFERTALEKLVEEIESDTGIAVWFGTP